MLWRKRPNAYKLRYCPSKLLCLECDHFDCAYIGLTVDSGISRLALNNKPYPLGFKKLTRLIMHISIYSRNGRVDA
ncbi:hypothetical protein H5410_017609 [Solanum commersonii]|uniref:Uncharacterized protein n=1 Tax=Solanum commersonii TaxID=4109 RepID=A0A9J5ZZS7_SOLCO|nr:hypothetical protein H5410_017609 [Solanum commersonii]